MQEFLVGRLGFFFLIGVANLILIGSLLLWLFAKTIAKIKKANFRNSLLITASSTIAYVGFYFLLAQFDFITSMWLVFILVSLTYAIIYIVISKLIWKCSWEQSIKANIIISILFWIFVYYSLKNLLQ
jgi:hypothetical protein